ncbi:hypothetical protein [Scytonema sp. NUACC26]
MNYTEWGGRPRPLSCLVRAGTPVPQQQSLYHNSRVFTTTA